MQSLELTWDSIAALLEPLRTQQFKPEGILRKYYQEGHGRPGLHFFKIRYAPGDVIMAQGAYSDYAGLHLSGEILVFDRPVAGHRPSRSCWNRPGPWMRVVETWALKRTRGLRGSPHPLFQREPHAGHYSRATTMLAHAISRLLRLDRRGEEDRLAQPSLIGTQVVAASHTDVPIARILEPSDDLPFSKRFIGVTSVVWNQPRSVTLVAGEWVEMVLVKRKALLEIIKRFPSLYEEKLTEFQNVILPGYLAANRLFRGLERDVDLDHVRDVIARQAGDDPGRLLFEKYSKGETIVEQGSASSSLYLIIRGIVRVTRCAQGGKALLHHLERDDFFGESCIEEGARRSAAVEALSIVFVLKLSRETVLRIIDEFPCVRDRMRGERERASYPDRGAMAGRLWPPASPPPEVASKLMMATNLLVIDLNRCTRCDQCVRACAEAHAGRPRFHRASPDPDLRFGRWEIAGACVHCIDAPCQDACPVGAVTLLDTGAVHIHRNRCIGCGLCLPACPFDVIDMYPPVTPEEAVSLKVIEENGHDPPAIATKCDLCLSSGSDPPCVVSCPYAAAHRGAPGVLFPSLKRWADFPDLGGEAAHPSYE
jgi:Fe-S-cluster-containing dehydrogenase component/CRP-like cAMP-binding protein